MSMAFNMLEFEVTPEVVYAARVIHGVEFQDTDRCSFLYWDENGDNKREGVVLHNNIALATISEPEDEHEEELTRYLDLSLHAGYTWSLISCLAEEWRTYENILD